LGEGLEEERSIFARNFKPLSLFASIAVFLMFRKSANAKRLSK
jgi:hypothetical protein